MPKAIHLHAPPGVGFLWQMHTLLDATGCKHHTFVLAQIEHTELMSPQAIHIARTADVIIADGYDHAPALVRERLAKLVEFMRPGACVVYRTTTDAAPAELWRELYLLGSATPKGGA